MIYTYVAKDGACTATMSENPNKTKHVDVRFFKNGKPFNRCIVRSSWILSEFVKK
jgi:hypothetical protein